MHCRSLISISKRALYRPSAPGYLRVYNGLEISTIETTFGLIISAMHVPFYITSFGEKNPQNFRYYSKQILRIQNENCEAKQS